MKRLLIVGIIASLVYVPLFFDQNLFAIDSLMVDEYFSITDSTSSDLYQVQSFQADIEPPYIKIINPNHCSPSFVNGSVTVQGVSADSDGVKMVEAFAHPIPFDGEIYFEPATPIEPDDWSKWSIPLNISDNRPNRILVHAYDFSGNEEWDETIVNNDRSKNNTYALENQSEIKIAFVEPTFTNAAYNLDSFYFFYSKYYSTPSEQEIKTDLDLLTGDIPLEYEIDYFQNIFNKVKETLPDSFVTVIGDEEVHDGLIFGKDDKNLYDVLIFLHNEYVTQQYYDHLTEYLDNGGSIILLNGNMFYAEVLFDEKLCTATLVEGHDWVFDGKTAKPSMSEKYLEENSRWFGSNYIVNALEDDVVFENNPFGYSHFEENHVTNPNAELLLNYHVKFAQPLLTEPSTNPFILGGVLNQDPEIQYSDEGKIIGTYELSSGNGKVIHMGLYAQRLDSNPSFLSYFEKIILPRTLDNSLSLENEFDIGDIYWIMPGGKISDSKLDPESRTLTIHAGFNPNSNELNMTETYLTVVIPKRVLDSHVENKMTSFIVKSNGITVPYEETADDVERGLKIKITKDSKIEIIGTSAIPEFELSMIVLVMSIFLLVLLSRIILKFQFLNFIGLSK